MSSLEKRISEERKQRTACEASLVSERKARRLAEEARCAVVAPQQALVRQECTDACKSRRAQMELDIKNLRRDIKSKDERQANNKQNKFIFLFYIQLIIDSFSFRLTVLDKDISRCKESHGETEILLSALSALQDKNTHLEKSLSAETRIKLDLFSALGEAKRQLEIKDSKFGKIQNKN